MKILYILRHAKAGQTNKNIINDHDRPLTEKGISQCAMVGKHLKKSKAKIDLIMSSTSRRTKETTELTLKELKKDIKTRFLSKLYLGGVNDILKQARKAEKSAKSLLIVGHNPGLHQLAASLVKEGDAKAIRNMIGNFPPGSLAVMQFDVDDWNEVKWRSGKLIDFFVSKSSS